MDDLDRLADPDRPGLCSADYRAPIPPGAGLVSDASIGPDNTADQRIEIDLVRPLESFRLAASAPAHFIDPPEAVYASGEQTGPAARLGLDLTWTTDGVPYHYDLTTRYEIPCLVSGTVTVDGETFTIDGQGQRDHSWGVRDWWAFGWCWCSVRLEDGTRVHLADIRMGIPDFPVFFGYVQTPTASSATVHPATALAVSEELGDHGFPSKGRIDITAGEPLGLEITPVAFGPVLLRNEVDGRVSRFPRAMVQCRTDDGRTARGLDRMEPARSCPLGRGRLNRGRTSPSDAYPRVGTAADPSRPHPGEYRQSNPQMSVGRAGIRRSEDVSRRFPRGRTARPAALAVAVAVASATVATLWMGTAGAAPTTGAPATTVTTTAAATTTAKPAPTSAATSTTTTFPAGATTADKWVLRAVAAEEKFGSVHVVGKIAQGKTTIVLELLVNSDGEGGGEFVQNGNLIKIERVGTLLYFNAPTKFWAAHATAAQTKTYGGKWIEFSATDSRFTSFNQFLDAADLAVAAFQGHTAPLTMDGPPPSADTRSWWSRTP